MVFDPNTYGPKVAGLLALEADGTRLMPLSITGHAVERVRHELDGKSAGDLFPGSRAPDAALAGLWLYFSFFNEAHSIAQDINTADGSYWHAILHRQEPDAGNAGYWFRRVGRHPVFQPLRAEAAKILTTTGVRVPFTMASEWDPFAFIEFCESARAKPGSNDERVALEIQLVEWQLLFDHCARGI